MKNVIFLFASILLLIPSSMTFGEEKVSEKNMVLLPVGNDPTISFRIWFKVGSQNDPAGKEGLAAITASMLTDASTQVNSYEQVLDKLFPLAADYSASTSVEQTIIYGRTHKDNIDEYYPLLMDAMLKPAFKQEDLDRIRSQALNYLENSMRYASDEELGKAILYNTIFAGSPYGHITTGLVESVKSITLDDIGNFYKKYYTADNVIVGLGGGYDAGLVEKIRKDLDALPKGAPKTVPKPKAKAINGLNVTIVDKDAQSTAISLGFPIDVLRGSKDYYALSIANSWLGQHRNSASHLYQVIREERGLNYGDYSYIENFPRGGGRMVPPQNVCRRQQIFEVWIRPVPNETKHFALRAALREVNNLVDKGMTESNFRLTRDFLKKFVLNYAPTTMERLGYALDDRFYGIKGSHLEIFRKMMDEIKLSDVNKALKKHLKTGNIQIAVVTKDAAGFREALINDAPSPITYKTPKPESVLNEDKEIIKYPIKVKPGNVTILKVADIFSK